MQEAWEKEYRAFAQERSTIEGPPLFSEEALQIVADAADIIAAHAREQNGLFDIERVMQEVCKQHQEISDTHAEHLESLLGVRWLMNVQRRLIGQKMRPANNEKKSEYLSASWREQKEYARQELNTVRTAARLHITIAKNIFRHRHLPNIEGVFGSLWNGASEISKRILPIDRGPQTVIESRNGIGRLVTAFSIFRHRNFEIFAPKDVDEDVHRKIDFFAASPPRERNTFLSAGEQPPARQSRQTVYAVQVKSSGWQSAAFSVERIYPIPHSFKLGGDRWNIVDPKDPSNEKLKFVQGALALRREFPGLHIVPLYLRIPAGGQRSLDIGKQTGLPTSTAALDRISQEVFNGIHEEIRRSQAAAAAESSSIGTVRPKKKIVWTPSQQKRE